MGVCLWTRMLWIYQPGFQLLCFLGPQADVAGGGDDSSSLKQQNSTSNHNDTFTSSSHCHYHHHTAEQLPSLHTLALLLSQCAIQCVLATFFFIRAAI